MRAVQNGDLEGIDQALNAGADPHISFQDDPECPGGTLLCQATARNHAHLIPHLLRAGISVDDCGAQERAPLHVAAEMGHEMALKMLLQHHGNTEVITRDEYSALEFLCTILLGHWFCEVPLYLSFPLLYIYDVLILELHYSMWMKKCSINYL